MPAPADVNLASARDEVMARLNLSAQRSLQGGSMVSMVESFIRQADRTLYFDRKWTRRKKLYTQTLIQGQGAYPWPGDVEAGGVESIRPRHSDGTLFPALIADEAETLAGGPYDLEGAPEYFSSYDGELHIRPRPSEAFTSMDIIYQAPYEKPVDPDDLLNVDDEAVVQLAVMLVSERLGDPLPAYIKEQFDHYMATLKRQQGSGNVIRTSRTRPAVLQRSTPDGLQAYYRRRVR